MKKIGFIGMGNMGSAILKSVLKIYSAEEIVFVDKDINKAQKISEETGVKFENNIKDCVNNVEYVIIAVKPQFINEVMYEINDDIKEDTIVISIAAGITIEHIKKSLGKRTKVVRVMPNTPALVGEGMSVISFSEDEYLPTVKDEILAIFNSCGKAMLLDERYMNAVVGISGSSPAYVYIFIEALADAGVKNGLPRDVAYTLAAQSVLGSAKMVLETGLHPAVLKDQVCSPAGTTIDAVAALEKFGFRNSIIEAVNSCYIKSVALGERK